MSSLLRCLFILLLFVPVATVSGEQVDTEPGSPVTTGDPNIPVGELKLRLRPLTQAEVKVEVNGWQKLLQKKEIFPLNNTVMRPASGLKSYGKN